MHTTRMGTCGAVCIPADWVTIQGRSSSGRMPSRTLGFCSWVGRVPDAKDQESLVCKANQRIGLPQQGDRGPRLLATANARQLRLRLRCMHAAGGVSRHPEPYLWALGCGLGGGGIQANQGCPTESGLGKAGKCGVQGSSSLGLYLIRGAESVKTQANPRTLVRGQD